MTFDTVSANRGLPVPAGLKPPSRFPRGSSEWWLDRLTAALAQRLRRFELLESYYRGTQDLAKLSSRAFREAGLEAMFPNLNANHSRLIVNATAQRLVVLGFRLPDELRADVTAAALWRANDLDTLADVAHKEALVKGECPVLVEPNPADPTRPVITPQDPSSVIVWTSAGDRRIRLAALKTWWDDDARRRLYTLYLPDRIERWQDRQPGQMDQWRLRLSGGPLPQWERRETEGMPAVVPNPLGEVPIVVLYNDPRLTGSPEGEHEIAMGLVDLYHKTLKDMATTSHFAAYRQRYGTGIDSENEGARRDPTTGQAIEPAPAQAETGQDTMLTSPFPDARFGTLEESDLAGYVKALDTIRADIGSMTFTPPYYLLNLPSSVPPSGDSITALEAAHTDKIRGHQRDKAAPWRRIIALAFRLAGDEARARAMREAGTVLWEDPERRAESQHIDALGKLVQMLDLPPEAAWELIPAGPEQIARWTRMRDEGGSPALTEEQVNGFATLFRSGVRVNDALRAVGVTRAVGHTGLRPVTLAEPTGPAAPPTTEPNI